MTIRPSRFLCGLVLAPESRGGALSEMFPAQSQRSTVLLPTSGSHNRHRAVRVRERYWMARWQSAMRLPGTIPRNNARSAFNESTVRISAEPPIFASSVGSSKYMSFTIRR